MDTLDPRHGTTAGYHAGCRQPCCRRAIAAYEKRGRLARLRGGRAVPAIGAQRRLQALMRLGWSSQRIAIEAGQAHRNHVLRILNGQKGKPTNWLQRDTDQWVRDVYDRLCMTVPDDGYAARTRAFAERQGWAPPLAWDDIDNDAAPVGKVRHGGFKDSVDEAMIDRVLRGGERPRKLTKAEAREVYRRALANGMTTYEIQTLYGLNLGRYSKDAA
jgi:hypothetical protein